jgi:hypothetical protein
MDPIPSIRVLNDFHGEVKHITADCNFQSVELRNTRRLFLSKTKEVQDMRGVLSLASQYYTKTNSSPLTEISQLPIIQSHSLHAVDRLMEISSLSSSVRSDISKFLKQLYAQTKKLPEIFACISDVNESPPYLPASLRIRDFLSCSTIPALFGYYWTVELQLAFIQFVSEVAGQLPSSLFTNLQEHWLIDLIKNYVLSSEIHRFFELATQNLIIQLCRLTDPTWERIATAARPLVDAMSNQIALFPVDVRYLLKRVSEAGKSQDPAIVLRQIETILMHTILAPALACPKPYGLIPKNIFLDSISAGPTRTLTMLAQVFHLM